MKKLNLEKNSCTLIGTFVRTHGIHGALVLEKEINFSENTELESILVEIDQLLVPFFVRRFSFRNHHSFLFELDDIDSEVSAAFFVNKEVYVPVELIEDSAIIQNELIGFDVFDKTLGSIGKVVDFQYIPGNDLLIVETPLSQQILIPTHPSILLEIDKKKSIILIDAPNGLIDINF